MLKYSIHKPGKETSVKGKRKKKKGITEEKNPRCKKIYRQGKVSKMKSRQQYKGLQRHQRIRREKRY